ncbi:MAG: hypothetical protein WCL50_08755 [Spirochaetota bacterium]
MVSALLSLSSCAVGSGDFRSGLAKLDGILLRSPAVAKDIAPEFSFLYSLARSVSDWLSIAKRCRAAEALGDSGRSRVTMEKALRTYPSSEVLLEVAAWLHLREAHPESVLALYSGKIDVDAHPSLWAEAVLALLSSGKVAQDLDPSGYARLAETSGDLSWYTDAALAAMRTGDRFAASAWLRAAMREGAIPPLDLLWDGGLFKELTFLIGRNPEPALLPLGGDAAWASGDTATAALFWRRALRANPELSWKVEAALAAIGPRGEAALASARRISSRHPDEPMAQRFAAALMVREARPREATALVPLLKREDSPLPSLLALELEAGNGSEDRLAAEAIRLCESFADSAVIRAGTMRILLERGRYEDFIVILDEAEAIGLAGPDSWFYSMLARLLRGEENEAKAIASREAAAPRGRRSASPSFGAFAEGILLSSEGALPEARERYQAALNLAESPRERAAILKETGRLELALGDEKKARMLWKAAAEADPGDAEAVLLATKKP